MSAGQRKLFGVGIIVLFFSLGLLSERYYLSSTTSGPVHSPGSDSATSSPALPDLSADCRSGEPFADVESRALSNPIGWERYTLRGGVYKTFDYPKYLFPDGNNLKGPVNCPGSQRIFQARSASQKRTAAGVVERGDVLFTVDQWFSPLRDQLLVESAVGKKIVGPADVPGKDAYWVESVTHTDGLACGTVEILFSDDEVVLSGAGGGITQQSAGISMTRCTLAPDPSTVGTDLVPPLYREALLESVKSFHDEPFG